MRFIAVLIGVQILYSCRQKNENPHLSSAETDSFGITHVVTYPHAVVEAVIEDDVIVSPSPSSSSLSPRPSSSNGPSVPPEETPFPSSSLSPSPIVSGMPTTSVIPGISSVVPPVNFESPFPSGIVLSPTPATSSSNEPPTDPEPPVNPDPGVVLPPSAALSSPSPQPSTSPSMYPSYAPSSPTSPSTIPLPQIPKPMPTPTPTPSPSVSPSPSPWVSPSYSPSPYPTASEPARSPTPTATNSPGPAESIICNYFNTQKELEASQTHLQTLIDNFSIVEEIYDGDWMKPYTNASKGMLELHELRACAAALGNKKNEVLNESAERLFTKNLRLACRDFSNDRHAKGLNTHAGINGEQPNPHLPTPEFSPMQKSDLEKALENLKKCSIKDKAPIKQDRGEVCCYCSYNIEFSAKCKGRTAATCTQASEGDHHDTCIYDRKVGCVSSTEAKCREYTRLGDADPTKYKSMSSNTCTIRRVIGLSPSKYVNADADFAFPPTGCGEFNLYNGDHSNLDKNLVRNMLSLDAAIEGSPLLSEYNSLDAGCMGFQSQKGNSTYMTQAYLDDFSGAVSKSTYLSKVYLSANAQISQAFDAAGQTMEYEAGMEEWRVRKKLQGVATPASMKWYGPLGMRWSQTPRVWRMTRKSSTTSWSFAETKCADLVSYNTERRCDYGYMIDREYTCFNASTGRVHMYTCDEQKGQYIFNPALQ